MNEDDAHQSLPRRFDDQMSPPRASFSTLPIELATTIFTLACTDGGETGCSLSLVSKSFRYVCKNSGADITTAVVRGELRLEKILSTLRRRRIRARRVRSLFLFFCASDDSEEMGDFRSNKDFASLMKSILKSISPLHLEILTINSCSEEPGPFSSILPVSFPYLRELSIRGAPYPTSFTRSFPAPNVQRLFIQHCHHLPDDFGAALTRLFPNLTHLRVDLEDPDADPPGQHVFDLADLQHRVGGTTVTIPLKKNVAQLLRIPKEGPLPAVPPRLRRVIAGSQYCADIDTEPCGKAFIYHLIQREQSCFGVSTRESEDGRSMFFLPAVNVLDVEVTEQAVDEKLFRYSRESWLERTNGTGEGCWYQDERISYCK
ncbi:hypothetical protein EIP91_011202 [Steccherinum ochraceum]|uniref:F-box domain-containing protein n=1 Tax=Steccherinum ochraceum TaxID=92696 RepID=A0A4R0R7Q6_9APHY|nr:hypothetical protein EIP91_011202 [Steccherinum ochraceum]